MVWYESGTADWVCSAAYHLAIKGQTTGPYDIAVMKQIIFNSQMTAEMLVWKPGMAS